jgi:hypothetical protein
MRKLVYYEKEDTILWALTPEGILLHNFANRRYVELKGKEHLIWSYLDGAHSLKDISTLLANGHADGNGSADGPIELVEETCKRLLAGGFIAKKSK